MAHYDDWVYERGLEDEDWVHDRWGDDDDDYDDWDEEELQEEKDEEEDEEMSREFEEHLADKMGEVDKEMLLAILDAPDGHYSYETPWEAFPEEEKEKEVPSLPWINAEDYSSKKKERDAIEEENRNIKERNRSKFLAVCESRCAAYEKNEEKFEQVARSFEKLKGLKLVYYYNRLGSDTKDETSNYYDGRIKRHGCNNYYEGGNTYTYSLTKLGFQVASILRERELAKAADVSVEEDEEDEELER